MLNSGEDLRFFVLCDLEIRQMALKNNRAPLLCCFKLCASFRSHCWIQTGFTVRKHQFWVKINDLFDPCKLEISQMTLKNNRAPFLSNIKLCASLHHHMWIQTGVTVRKRLNWVLTSVTLTFYVDITSVIGDNSWKFHDDTMTGTLWKRCNRRTNQPTEGRTHRDVLRAAWSQLKMSMTQVMVCCLIAPSHYLQHGWLAINMVLWLSTKANFTGSAQKNIERHTAHTIVSWPNPKQ